MSSSFTVAEPSELMSRFMIVNCKINMKQYILNVKNLHNSRTYKYDDVIQYFYNGFCVESAENAVLKKAYVKRVPKSVLMLSLLL